MSAIVLRQPSGMAASPALEVIFKCRDGILLRVPAHTVFHHPKQDSSAMESDDPRRIGKLMRELIAFKRAKKR